jgi:hypothetical protein
MREPDWAALADVQFMLYNRLTNQLNEALSGIALIDMPEAQDKPPGYWKERATTKIVNVLNLFTAWTWLARFKMGEPIPERAVRPFRTNDLLKWVSAQLQLYPVPVTTSNPLLRGNQETLQEALLLLHSVAYTQGSSVRLAFEATKLGTWLRIRFDRARPLPTSLDDLIASFGDHWRAKDTEFELKMARDFIQLNGCELTLIATASYGEFSFFVRAASAGLKTDELPATRAATASPAPDAAQAKLFSDDTPVIKEKPPEPAPPAPAPTLAVLRPLPPQALPKPQPTQSLPKTSPLPPAAPPPPMPPAASAEGRAQPVEPDETPSATAGEPPQTESRSAGVSHTADTIRRKLAGPAGTPPSPAPTSSDAPPDTRREGAPDKRKTDTVIVKLNLPEPKLPERLRTPPAATSHADPAKETPTLSPVPPETPPPPPSEPAADAPASAQEERP